MGLFSVDVQSFVNIVVCFADSIVMREKLFEGSSVSIILVPPNIFGLLQIPSSLGAYFDL